MIAIAAYSDRTMSRSVGNISYWPMMLSILNMPVSMRQQTDKKLLLGHAPVLVRPAAVKNGGSYANKVFSDAQATVLNCCWGQVAKHLHEADRPASGIPSFEVTLADGTNLKCLVRLIMFVGDHPELQTLCGVSEGWSASWPCRMCLVPHDETDKFFKKSDGRGSDSVCQLRTAAKVLKQVSLVASSLLFFSLSMP